MNKIFIKTGVMHFGFFMLMFALMFSCKKESLTGRQIIEKAVEAHGGVDNWNALKALSFNKKTALFYEDGSVELETNQLQLFRFGVEPYGRIEWKNSKHEQIKIVFENGIISKSVNDSVITSTKELERAENSFWAAYYVACKPFDLLQETVPMKFTKDLIYKNKQCYEVELDYGKEGDNWFYIIDAETYEVVANKVKLKDHTSFIENLTFDTETDFIFNSHRKSYRLNDKGEKTYLRAEYYYSNFKIE